MLGLKAPSSGRTKVIAPAASLAASSSTSVRASASGIGTHSPVTEPLVKVRSLLRAGSRERKTYSVPLSSPLRASTVALAERSFLPTYMYSWLSRVAGPSSVGKITVRVPWPGWTTLFSLLKRPSLGSVCSSPSKMATDWPPRPSKLSAPPDSSLVR